MKTKTKKKLFGVLSAALCAAVTLIFTANPNGKTTAIAMGNTALQTFTGYESATHKASADEYTERYFYNTGIKIYGAANNGASKSGNTITVDCNAVCIDFSAANAFATPKVSSGIVSATTQSEYAFEILQGDSVKWYASFVRTTYTKEVEENGETVTKTYSKKTLNVNGKTSVITSESANYTTFVASDFKTNAANLQDGTYTIKITRKFGWTNWGAALLFMHYNSTSEMTGTLIVDTIAPLGKVIDGNGNIVRNGGYSSSSQIYYTASDAGGSVKYYVKKPNANGYSAYTVGAALTSEGEYTFYCTDGAGNRSENYTVTIDRRKPTASLYADGAAYSGKYTNAGHISFESDAEELYVKVLDSAAYKPYASGTEYGKAGKYSFYDVTKSGVTTGVYEIIIDRTEKPLEIDNVENGRTDGDVTIEWNDSESELFAPIKTVTVNGKEYTKGDTIYTIETGKYTVESVDEAGNVWRTEFVSDKQNVFTKTLKKEYFETTDLQDEDVAVASYESAYKFALNRENALVSVGEWKGGVWDAGLAIDEKDEPNAKTGKYFVYKSENNAEEKVAYFTETRLNEVVKKYAENSVKQFYFWQKEPAEAYAGENLYSETIVADKVELGENIRMYSDGEEFMENEFAVAGKHTLTIRDEWNNSCDYAVIIVSRAPDILYSVNDGNENKAAFDRAYKLESKVNVSVVDALDEAAMLCVYDADENLLAVLSLGEKYTIDKSGEYSVVAVNRFGKSGAFALSVTVEIADDTPTETPSEEKPADSGNGDVNDAKDSGSKAGLIIGLSAFGVACVGAVCFILVKKRREF